jgi:hypothetical protein
MNRVALHQVEEAYRKTGITPCTGSMGGDEKTDSLNTACALGVLAATEGIMDCRNRWCWTDTHFDPHYVIGFITGFDNATLCDYHKENIEICIGFNDGQVVRNHIIKTFGPFINENQ